MLNWLQRSVRSVLQGTAYKLQSGRNDRRCVETGAHPAVDLSPIPAAHSLQPVHTLEEAMAIVGRMMHAPVDAGIMSS